MLTTGTKIALLAAALKSGEVMSPLLAWDRWRMAHNTYHRSIYGLSRRHGLRINSQMVIERGIVHSMHWLEGVRWTISCDRCGRKYPDGYHHECGNQKAAVMAASL